MKPCRHRKAWVISGLEWCYQCGAFRRLGVDTVSHKLCVMSTWCKPTGTRGKNPYAAWQKANDAMSKRRAERANRRNWTP